MVECCLRYSLSRIVYKLITPITPLTSRAHPSQLRVIITHFSIRFNIWSCRMAQTWLSPQIGSDSCNVSQIQLDVC